MKNRKTLFQQISTLKNLPTLPQILLKLIDTCNQESGSLKEVSKIIEKDPSLSIKILRLVNSSYYGLAHRVENMDQAVSLVGTDAIKNIAICASVYETFSKIKGNAIFNLKLFWWHCLKCAVLSRLIAKKTGYSHPDEAFLTGLLHDIGRLVLWVNFPEQYGELLETYKDQQHLLITGELRLGATHCEVGAWLFNRWKLQPLMADSVLYHHEPEYRILNALPLVQIVYVANALCREPVQEGLKVAKEILGFRDNDVLGLLSNSDEEAKEVAQSLHIEIEQPKDLLSPFSQSDITVREDLAREVKDFSLLLGTLQDLLGADEQDAILKVLYEGIQILFDVKDVLFFLYDPDKDALIGKTAPEDKKYPVAKDLIIPLRMEKALLIKSLRQGKPLDSFSLTDDPTPIILDDQIIRIIGKEGVFCLPMLSHGELVGVIVIGLDQVEFSHLSKHLKLLDMFANQAALSLHADHLRQSRLKEIQSERLSASSALSRKVIHEVTNPLNIIKNYLKILDIKMSEQDMAQDEIRIINEEIDRIALLIRELSDFSKERVSKKEPVDVNDLLSDLVKITKEYLLKDFTIKLHLDLKPSLPTIMTEKSDLKQVLMNLLQNAVEAMVGGGDLHIQTRRISIPLGRHLESHEEGYVEITISDNGIGIPDEIKSRIFEPFFSSKGGSHSGLGLSIVHNIIKALNGTITCESSKDKGTVFKIELPIAHSNNR